MFHFYIFERLQILKVFGSFSFHITKQLKCFFQPLKSVYSKLNGRKIESNLYKIIRKMFEIHISIQFAGFADALKFV